MGLNAKIIQRFTRSDAHDLTHSSAFTRLRRKGSTGFSTNAGSTFAQRRELELNRQNIAAYKSSAVAQGGNRRERALSVQDKAAADATKAGASTTDSSIAADNGASMSLREANIKMHKQGLQGFDKGMQAMSGAAEVAKVPSMMRNSQTSHVETYAQRQAASYRAAQADRFAGGVRRVGGTAGGGISRVAGGGATGASQIRPNIKPNFGGH